MATEDERPEELETLQSIYPELVYEPTTSPFAASLELLVAPTVPLPVTFEQVRDHAEGPDAAQAAKDVHRLAYLPPLRVNVELPAQYPADAPPKIVVSTSPPWLPADVISKLQSEAYSLWEEYSGGQMLFAYISFLQEAAETTFDLAEIILPVGLKDELLQYSMRTKKELFDKETFDCEVCLEPKKGSICYRMERCNHVFCVNCLKDYYNNCIKEGDVNNVKCMSTDCGTLVNGKKKERLLSPKELLKIPLSLEMVNRYAKIKRKKRIEADPDMIYCPRSWCQGAMRTDKYPKIKDVRDMDDSDSEADEPIDTPSQEKEQTQNGPEVRRIGRSGTDRLAVCEDCTLAFCKVCLSSWHGDFVRCEPRDNTQLTEEDQASLNFILKNTSPCPTCSVPCQKSYGCNHMTCFQCKTHFCYLCGAWLAPENPYGHFNNPKNKGCFNKLMELVDGDMANGGGQFGGRRGAEQVADFWEQEAQRMQDEWNAQAD